MPYSEQGTAMVNHKERILIVDDVAAIRRLLHLKLSKEGYQCEEAGSAVEALGKLRSNLAELVLLDIMMPGKSGIELLPEIKTNYPDTAVIMVTSIAERSIALECVKRGADGYVIKSLSNLESVVMNVRSNLERRKRRLKVQEWCNQHQS
jgi:CheY-like chemotaxis protein